MIRPALVALLVLFSLSACQSDILRLVDDSMFARLSGGTFTLHRDVVIAPGRVRITFQNGTASHGASEFEPRCELEVWDILDRPQTIPAGSYRIGKVTGMQRFVNRPPAGSMLAASNAQVRLADDTTGDWSMYTYRMPLISEQQENAPHLICGGAYDYPFYARYPTLQEMHKSLGDYATLKLR